MYFELANILLFAGLAFFTVFIVLVVTKLARPSQPSPAKNSTYECGMPPIGNARARFPVKFFLVCMIFILLDVDAAFLYPWALIYRDLGLFGFVEMGVFIALLGGGFAYAWKVGALDW